MLDDETIGIKVQEHADVRDDERRRVAEHLPQQWPVETRPEDVTGQICNHHNATTGADELAPDHPDDAEVRNEHEEQGPARGHERVHHCGAPERARPELPPQLCLHDTQDALERSRGSRHPYDLRVLFALQQGRSDWSREQDADDAEDEVAAIVHHNAVEA